MTDKEMMIKKLSAKGWVEVEKQSLHPIFKDADVIMSQKTANDLKHDFGFIESENILRWMFDDGSDKKAFKMQVDNLEVILDKLLEVYSKISCSDYFGYYCDMQDVCDISILAHEQWEEGYQ